MAGITRRLELRIAGEGSSLSAPLNLYRGDRGIDIYFRVMDFSYDFTGTNLLRNIGSARYNAIVVKPDGSNYVTPTQPIVDNEVKFTITKDLTDEMTEIGTYTLQFLFHGVGDSRVAIPPITIEVKELIADVADGADGQANYSTTNKTTIKAGQATIEARWEIGELITADKLNWTRDKAIQGAETSQANSNKISVLEPKVATLEKKVTPLQTDVQTLKEKVDDFQNINIMNQEVNGVESITINNTYDGVTKDLVIKGQTLFNIYNPEHCKGGTLDEESFRKLTLTTSPGWHTVGYQSERTKFIPFYKENTTYTIIAEIAENTLSGTGELFRINEHAPQHIFTTSVKLPNNFTGVFVAKVRTKSDFSSITHGIYPCLTSYCTSGTIKIRFMIIEGDLSEDEIPSTYFDSITSTGEQEDNKIILKSNGKNLIDKNKIVLSKCIYPVDGRLHTNRDSVTLKVTSNTRYSLNVENAHVSFLSYFKEYTNYGYSFISGVFDSGAKSFTTPPNTKYITISLQPSTNWDIIQLEEGSIATNYEPYVENIKEIKIPFENGLKSLPNSVCDEIKEKEIIQRVGRVVLNGSENWNISVKTSATNTSCFQFMLEALGGEGLESVCDKLPYIDGLWKDEPQYDKRGYDIASNGNLIVRELKSNLPTQDVAGWKKYLQTNPMVVYYELAEPITHPLYEDYSLKTYQEVTHIHQENNICGDINVSVPSNRDGIIHANTMEIIDLNDKLENTFDYLGGKIPVYVPESFVGNTTIKDSMVGEVQQLGVKGNTLQNLLNNKNIEFDSANNRLAIRNSENKSLFANKTYTLFNLSNKTIRYTIDRISNNSYIREVDVSANTISVVILNEDEYISIIFGAVKDGWENSEDSKSQLKQSCVILEGSYNYNPFNAYFDSITSAGEQEDNKIKIKSVGKNLFEPNYFNENAEAGNITRKLTYKLKPNTKYTCSSNIPKADGKPATVYFNGGSSDTDGVFLNMPKTFTSNSLGEIDLFIRVNGETGFTIQDFINGDMWIQLEENTIATNYEQYRAKPIEIPLPFAKGLKSTLDNSVYDEINGNTGEIIQRVSDEYTALAKPIIHKINNIQLNTFDTTTHITQENNIVANIKMLIPVSLNKSIGRVQDENGSLTKENRILKEDNKIVAEALLNILQPISTLDEKGVEYKPHSQEEIINKLIEILNR